MEKDRAIELLIQAVDEIPHLKTLHYQNDEIELWLDKVENILRAGLKPEDYGKYWPVSQALEILKGVYEDNIYQEQYLKKITNYEVALKSILLKYEILGMEEREIRGGEVEKMDKAEKQKVVELEKLIREFRSYKRLLKNKSLTKTQEGYMYSLRSTLQRKIGTYGDLIIALTGKRWASEFNYRFDFWVEALRADPLKSRTLNSIETCIQSINEAIGKLEAMPLAELEKEKPAAVTELPPKAFISHGKASAALNKLTEFLETLGINPLIVKRQPSLDKTVDAKVEYYLNQADLVIALATGDDEVEGKRQPRQNVIHEIGLAQKTHPGRIIYLLEEGTEFPSNIRPKVWESFKQRNMINAFLGIVRELRAYGMLKLTKPQTEEQTS